MRYSNYGPRFTCTLLLTVLPMLLRGQAFGFPLLSAFIGSVTALGWTQGEQSTEAVPVRNVVIVIGMVHGPHCRSGPFDLVHPRELIRVIDPEVVLTETPPERLEPAATEYRDAGAITEPRVSVLPA